MLKSLVLSISFLSCLQAFGAPLANPPQSFLTPTEATQLVRAIDNICGDTWCEGDFNYQFDQLVCNSAECYFDLQILTRNSDDQGNWAQNQSRAYRCQLQGFHSRDDLVATTASPRPLQYSEKLYEAVGQCISAELPIHFPVVYLPKSSSCSASLHQKAYYKSAAHSAYAEVFYEIEDKAQASAKTLTQMVEAYAAKDPSCSLQYFMIFRDQVACERMGGLSEVCSLPTDAGQFVVMKDGVDSAAVIYMDPAKKPASLGTLLVETQKIKVVQPEFCYTELLNLDSKQNPQAPFNSSDHHNYFVSAKNLNPSVDARLNAAQLIKTVVTSVSKSSGSSCQIKTATQSVAKNVCKNLGGVDVCAIAGPQAGYYLVVKDNDDGAFVSFMRFD